MDNELPKKYSFSGLQKVLLGIAIAFFALYKFALKDPDIVKNLGSSYAYVMMVWTIIMLFSAGLSGWELAQYLIDIVKEKFGKKITE